MTVQLLSRDAEGRVVPSAVERMRGRLPREDAFVGWASSIAVTLLALFLRLWRLGEPHKLLFDETYYAKDAWSLVHFGYARDYVDNANDLILGGQTTGLWKSTPELIVHPEVGKWMIALGEMAFGMNPYGWRISAAVTGSLMVLVMCRLARRLTGSTMLGCLAGLLLCFDGLQLVLSRLALLDIFQAFWLLSAVAACVTDRDWVRTRLGRAADTERWRPGSYGPLLLVRPWLLVAGVCFGLSTGSKWGSAFPMVAFGLLVWLWAAGARRSLGVRRALPRSLLADAPIAFVHLIVVAFVVYVATWAGWLIHAHQYEKYLSDTQYTTYQGGHQWPTATEPQAHGLAGTWQALRSLYYYHRDVLTFHTHFLNDATHIYQSRPRAWPLVNRGVGADAQQIQPGDQGCATPVGTTCIRQVLLLPNPTLWWAGLIGLGYAVVGWVARRDWRYAVIVLGFLTTWVPWFRFDQRPIFLFYAINMLPFTILGLTMLAGRLLSGPVASLRRTVGTIVVGSVFVLVLLNFAWFWPIYTDGLLTKTEWIHRIWFSRWI